MPLYEYKCASCGDVFEVIQKFSDQPLTAHEKCGGKLERLVSSSAFQFKGSGWYVTDYAKHSGSSPSNGKPESKSESKPESKSEAKASSDTKTSDSK